MPYTLVVVPGIEESLPVVEVDAEFVQDFDELRDCFQWRRIAFKELEVVLALIGAVLHFPYQLELKDPLPCLLLGQFPLVGFEQDHVPAFRKEPLLVLVVLHQFGFPLA